MADSIDPERRSELMSRIRRKDTKPELVVRKFLYGLGFRYRLHASDLPGTPDIVMRSRRTAIFVHGCFWHRHEKCRLAYTPKSRTAFWKEKFARNQERDGRVQRELEELGWTVLTVWECEIRSGRIEWLPNAISKSG